MSKEGVKLNEWKATAICGNDITSSCLYVSALSIFYAGQYAWISLLIVALVLFLFRRIYGEVVGALPLNGGAYNALLNTTRKPFASVAACLTILSYMATAVISATEAIHYLHNIFEAIPVFYTTIGLLLLFMFLGIVGVGESAKVALGIFIIHISTLTLLCLTCIIYVLVNGVDTLVANFHLPTEGSLLMALFFGFSAAMLGISGFESSANFVEEQAPGVFPKTLRNMWVLVSVFNPLIAFLAICVLPMGAIKENQEALLSVLGFETTGQWLAIFISVDAFLVLSGAVLTSFVGVGGLVERMTLDRILPQPLLKKNKRGVSYRIMIGFFLLCLSVMYITNAELPLLAGVYTFSFLAVMGLFAIGNMLLKTRRSRLPRPVKASPPSLLIALVAIIIAYVGNIQLDEDNFPIFLQYFVVAMLAIAIMLYRIQILKFILLVIDYVARPFHKMAVVSQIKINRIINRINAQEFVFFTKGDNIEVLNKVILYVLNNENTRRLKIVSVTKDGGNIDQKFLDEMDVLDRVYPQINIRFVTLKGTFGPELIEELSKKWNVPKNFMFIGSHGDAFPYRIAELGGVRLII